jgi:hypothetical protein
MQLSVDLGFCEQSHVAEILDVIWELKRMLNALRRTLMKQ